MLTVDKLNLYYGAIHALHDISFEVRQGEIVSLIGANGAGKTSILSAISGLVPIKSGDVTFDQKKISKAPPHSLIYQGLAHVPEGRRVFAKMTVKENLEMGAFSLKDQSSRHEDIQRIYTHFPRLKERRHQLAGTLSGGEQQMLAMGRALMGHPTLVMMDEPSMGLSPILVQEIFAIVKEINQSGTTVLLVEQNAHMALSIAHRAYVLETGRIVMAGDAKELLHNADVKKAYLGTA